MGMVVHPREHDLVIGTHGRAAYVLDDISPLRSISAEAMAEPIHLFAMPDAQQYRVKQTGASRFPGNGEYRGENRRYGAMLTFSLNADDLEHPNDEIERQRKAARREAGAPEEPPTRGPEARRAAAGRGGPGGPGGFGGPGAGRSDRAWRGRGQPALHPDPPGAAARGRGPFQTDRGGLHGFSGLRARFLTRSGEEAASSVLYERRSVERSRSCSRLWRRCRRMSMPRSEGQDRSETKRGDREGRRRDILRAAADILETRGYAEMNMRAIALGL